MLKGLKSGHYSSISKAANICGVAYTTLRRRFHGGKGRVGGHEVQQLLTAAEEQAIVHWIYRLELAAFPPWIEHVREAVMILRDEPDDLDAVIGKNWIIRFFDRRPEPVAKPTSAFDKKRVKASDSKGLN